MTWADEAANLATADTTAKRAFVERAVSMNTEGIDDGEIHNALRKIAAGYRMGTIALDLEDARCNAKI